MSVSNHVSATLDAATQQSLLTSLTEIRKRLPFLAGLSVDERMTLPKMGDKSLGFVEQALRAAEAHPSAMPSAFDVAEFRRDLQLWNALKPVSLEIARLNELMNDTLLALGSDLYTGALTTYTYLKASGNADGLDELKSQLGKRFNHRAAPSTAAATLASARA